MTKISDIVGCSQKDELSPKFYRPDAGADINSTMIQNYQPGLSANISGTAFQSYSSMSSFRSAGVNENVLQTNGQELLCINTGQSMDHAKVLEGMK